MTSFGTSEFAASNSDVANNEKSKPVKYEILDVFEDSDCDGNENEPICIDDDDDNVHCKNGVDKCARFDSIDLTQDIELTKEQPEQLTERLIVNEEKVTSALKPPDNPHSIERSDYHGKHQSKQQPPSMTLDCDTPDHSHDINRGGYIKHQSKQQPPTLDGDPKDQPHSIEHAAYIELQSKQQPPRITLDVDPSDHPHGIKRGGYIEHQSKQQPPCITLDGDLSDYPHGIKHGGYIEQQSKQQPSCKTFDGDSSDHSHGIKHGCYIEQQSKQQSPNIILNSDLTDHPHRIDHSGCHTEHQQSKQQAPSMAFKGTTLENHHPAADYTQLTEPLGIGDMRWLMTPQDVEIDPKWSNIQSGDLIDRIPDGTRVKLANAVCVHDDVVCIDDDNDDNDDNNGISVIDNTVSYTVIPFDDTVIDVDSIATATQSKLTTDSQNKDRNKAVKTSQTHDKAKSKHTSKPQSCDKAKSKSIPKSQMHDNAISISASQVRDRARTKLKLRASGKAKDKSTSKSKLGVHAKVKSKFTSVSRSCKTAKIQYISKCKGPLMNGKTLAPIITKTLADIRPCFVKLHDIMRKEAKVQQSAGRSTSVRQRSDQCNAAIVNNSLKQQASHSIMRIMENCVNMTKDHCGALPNYSVVGHNGYSLRLRKTVVREALS